VNTVPNGWVVSTFAELFDRLQYGLTAKADSASFGTRFLRITDLEGGSIDWQSVPGLVFGGETDQYRLDHGDFVFARSGSVEKAARIEHPPDAVFASYLIRGKLLSQSVSDWLRYFILSEDYLRQIRERAAGIGMSNVNATKFSSISVALPPFAEQHRIIAKIDSLFGKTKRARVNLDHTPRLVEKYKQAILASAFRGELTREWSSKNAHTLIVDNHSSKIDARLTELPDLPSNWRWQAISEVMGISGGLIKNPTRSAMAMRRPYLRVANVYANELRLAEIAETGCTEKEFEKTKLVPGDLLIVEGNGSLEQIGRVAIWNNEISECSHQNHIIRARPSEIVEPRYALFWLLSPAGRKAIEAVASSSSGLHTLSITKVGGLPIPLCAKPEQVEIVRLIENAFVWIDRLGAETNSARRLNDHLEQAILTKAFRGELVPQDPNDESASVLLERIRAERLASPEKVRGRAKK
jgi:type I restriction enzyme S subunit